MRKPYANAMLPVLAGAALCALLVGCLEEKCDPGYDSHRGACYPIHIDSGLIEPPGGDEDGGEPAAPECAVGEGFGLSCVDEDDCTCGTHCIPVLNICSVLNCEDTPEVCPPDWQCRDIREASTDPNVTSICLAPP